MASFGLIGLAGGVGGEMVKQADREIESAGKMDFERWRMGVLNEMKMQEEARAEQRDIRGEQRKVATSDMLRRQQVERIGTKAGELADQAVTQKRGLVQSGIADQEAWTPEQQATVDQSLARDKQAIEGDTKTRTQAAIATGDISPKDAATLDQKSEADLTRLMLGEQRNQTMALIASGHDDTRKLVAGMAAAAKRDGSSKEDRVLVHQFLAQFDRKIAGNQSEIRSLRASLKNSFDPKDQADIKAQISDLEAANRNLEKAQMSYASDSGIKVPKVEEAPAPAPAAGGKPWEKYGRQGK